MSGKQREKHGGTLVIKREEGAEHGHHGGAWKVAYADFVTAMMAFFLLMWLLSSTTEEQRLGIANYFAPTTFFNDGKSGMGKPFHGLADVHDESHLGRSGTPTVEQQLPGGPPPQDDTRDSSGENEGRSDNQGEMREPHRTGGHFANPRTVGAGGEDATDRGALSRDDPSATAATIAAQAEAEAAAAAETQALEQAAEAMREAITADPTLAELGRQIAIDVTPEGLRVQLLDAERAPMFTGGSAEPSDRVRALLAKVAPTLAAIGNPVTIIGHTDSSPFRSGSGQTNWELSADRANATRRVLTESGLPDARIRSVTGVADREPLLPADPRAAANRRIGILIQREHPAPRS
jgi:chemotaxis protein MotB